MSNHICMAFMDLARFKPASNDDYHASNNQLHALLDLTRRDYTSLRSEVVARAAKEGFTQFINALPQIEQLENKKSDGSDNTRRSGEPAFTHQLTACLVVMSLMGDKRGRLDRATFPADFAQTRLLTILGHDTLENRKHDLDREDLKEILVSEEAWQDVMGLSYEVKDYTQDINTYRRNVMKTPALMMGKCIDRFCNLLTVDGLKPANYKDYMGESRVYLEASHNLIDSCKDDNKSPDLILLERAAVLLDRGIFYAHSFIETKRNAGPQPYTSAQVTSLPPKKPKGGGRSSGHKVRPAA